MEAINALINLLKEQPIVGLLTLIILAVFALIIFYGISKVIFQLINFLVKLFSRKKVSLSLKDGIKVEGGSDIDEHGEDKSSIGPEIEVIPDLRGGFSEESLVIVICEFQRLTLEYYDTLKTYKDELFDDQVKKFRTELKKYINSIKDKYFEEIKEDPYTVYGNLFSYWFDTAFDTTQDDIKEILKRNHLKFKTSEEFEDIIRQCYDTTFGEILENIERAPEFIKDKRRLRAVIIQEKNAYRTYIDTSLQHAKKLSCETADKIKEAKATLAESQEKVIQRGFPKVDSAKIMESLNVR